MISIDNILSETDIDYINNLSEVIENKSKLNNNNNNIKFSIILTNSIREKLETKLAINLSTIESIPMQWVQGDVKSHIDRGVSNFTNTYLVYLNDNPGKLIINGQDHPIKKNRAYTFNEGTEHKTEGTELSQRLLIGPMSETGSPVGTTPIRYFANLSDAQNGSPYLTYSSGYIIGQNLFDSNDFGNPNTPNILFVQSINSWLIEPTTSSIGGSPTYVAYSNGQTLLDTSNNIDTSYNIYYYYNLYPNAPCFLEGSKILCQINGEEVYQKIEEINPGTLIKTSLSGYKKVEYIGHGTFNNPDNENRHQMRLYRCDPKNYPEITESLIITGCHSILVDYLSEKQKKGIENSYNKIFITENKYRLPAFLDERAEPWLNHGNHTIWHLALENDDYYYNYGIYANGLLVETSSKRFMKELSNLTLK